MSVAGQTEIMQLTQIPTEALTLVEPGVFPENPRIRVSSQDELSHAFLVKSV